MSKKIYLAGPISGMTYEGSEVWRDEFRRKLDPRIDAYSPLRGKQYLPLSSDKGITTRDRYDCMGADLVVFYLLGATRISIGTMIELGWADAARNPAILIMEKEGNVHEHPMLRETTHFRVDNLEDAVKLANIILLPGDKK